MSSARPVRKGAAPVEYRVEQTTLGETLCEHHLGENSQTFRCPKAIYDAVVDVISNAGRALRTDEIVDEVEAVLNRKPADHQYRVTLRFLIHADPAPLLRHRARYQPADPATFQKAAALLWTSLKG